MASKFSWIGFASLALVTVACGAGDSDEDPNEATGATSAGIDAKIRSDLRLALSVGARCEPEDTECRASVRERVTRGDRSDPVLARIADLVARIERAEICAQTGLVKGGRALFVVGADNIVADRESTIVFDLEGFRAAVLTARDGLSAITSGPYEGIASSVSSAFPDAWAGPFRTADSGLKLDGSAWASDGVIGAARLAGEPARRALSTLTVVDGSTFGDRPVASPTSAIALTQALEPLAKRAGAIVSFGSGVSTATAIAQIAGLEGWGPRAAAIAIARDRAKDLDAYCGATLTTRSFNVTPRTTGGAQQEDVVVTVNGTSIATGFRGVTQRSQTASGTAPMFDCRSENAALQCGAVYGDKPLFCAFAGTNGGTGSCCREPIRNVDDYTACTAGPDSGCPAGTACSQAAPDGTQMYKYICVPQSLCQAVEETPSGLPAETIKIGTAQVPPGSRLTAEKLQQIAREELGRLELAVAPTRRVIADFKLVTEKTTTPLEYLIEAAVRDATSNAKIATVSGRVTSQSSPSPEFLDEMARAAVVKTLKSVVIAAGGRPKDSGPIQM
jgi:hypothetical protein